MLNEFSAAWNNLYKDHPSEYLIGSVTITELDEEAKNKTFMVRCSEFVETRNHSSSNTLQERTEYASFDDIQNITLR